MAAASRFSPCLRHKSGMGGAVRCREHLRQAVLVHLVGFLHYSGANDRLQTRGISYSGCDQFACSEHSAGRVRSNCCQCDVVLYRIQEAVHIQ